MLSFFYMKKVSIFILILFFTLNSAWSFSKKGYEKVYLWRGIKGMETNVRDTVLHVPKIETINSENKKRTAMIICPGGSYHHLGMYNEGFSSAEFFKSQDVVPFVLQYRVAYNGHHHPEMLEDLQMAINYVRSHAEEYGIDKNKLGCIGYSAGGHLVLMAGAFGNTDELAKLGFSATESLRPNFVAPIYPVVSMQDDIAHKRSRKNLIGRKYTKETQEKFSMELSVPDDMVPVFLLACKDDPVVKFENSERLYNTLREKKIPFAFYIYPKGGHGFGISDCWLNRETQWYKSCLIPWMKRIDMLK